ncbi:hypothetical protein HMPREF1144_0321 [Klebsiella sp. OBRC7]|nr:hypothetical protein HMPREF1144_0321 [Klebsiella sp. OBRC7]
MKRFERKGIIRGMDADLLSMSMVCSQKKLLLKNTINKMVKRGLNEN